jgi:type I restriction enzyme M protein
MPAYVEPETETVVKRILPYLRRRGYDDARDLRFEAPAVRQDRYARGYVDILVTCGEPHPLFVIEAKRVSRAITAGDERQALDYGRSLGVPFVVITNGRDVRSLNVATGEPIRWDGKLVGRIPTEGQVRRVVAYLRRNPGAQLVPLGNDESLPFKPGLPLRQLNRLFAKCHAWIRNIEKREDDAFADFSKLLFLKLLEEKADVGGPVPPYSYRFWELARYDDAKADQVKTAINQMIADLHAAYGDVLGDRLKLTQAATYLKIARALADVSFIDSEADVKGAAFEYFVRATLKGKKLGQYFTPRPLVVLMATLLGRERIINALAAGTPVRVVDPACGTGGFLVYLMRETLALIDRAYGDNRLTATTRDTLVRQVKEEVFHGADANDGVASAAKMNMIIAGDGHANIAAEDTLTASAQVWNVPDGIDVIVTNPPFGTSESDSLQPDDLSGYTAGTSRGQLLFLERMLAEVKPEGLICTVIDEGMLNTETAQGVRRTILERAYVRAVVRLPTETFRPNKINVRSALLLLERRLDPDPDLQDRYPVRFIDIRSLGYDGSGVPIRGFDFPRLMREIESWMRTSKPRARQAPDWSSFVVPSSEIARDATVRFDLKYWDPVVRRQLVATRRAGAVALGDLNTTQTQRGKSPSADLYVDQADGYARVLKAGSSITPFGEIAPIVPETDFLERDEYEKLPDSCGVQRWDVLISSTGTGTLGKAAVYESKEPAIADGHITIVRVDRKVIDPRYLADYLRIGFGQAQIQRLFTGSTGLIELTPQHVEAILIVIPSLPEQRAAARTLRRQERRARAATHSAQERLVAARARFAVPA